MSLWADFVNMRAAAPVLALALAAGCGGGANSPAGPTPSVAQTARYRVTFDAAWSASTHPTDFPSPAHFSGLVGATHGSAASFWGPGGFATEGIRAMAERGSKSPLTSEVDQAVAGRRAEFVLSGPSLASSPGSVTLDFDISQAFPLVTLVTMIAPSPDWFVGVAGLPLFEAGAWRDSVRVDLFPYDAGTDSGQTFQSADLETLPRQPIARLTGVPFLNGGQVLPMGAFTFRRLQ